MLGFLVQWNVGRLEIIFYVIIYEQIYKVKEIICRKFGETTSIEIQSQHWGVNRQSSMEVIAVEYFSISIDSGSNEKIYNLIHI